MLGDETRDQKVMVSVLGTFLRDPSIIVTFSGRRFYRLVSPSAEYGDALCAKFEPVGRYGTFPASEECDQDYASWLRQSGRCDPAFDEVVLPSYTMVVDSPLGPASKIKVQVDLVRGGRAPLMRVREHEAD